MLLFKGTLFLYSGKFNNIYLTADIGSTNWGVNICVCKNVFNDSETIPGSLLSVKACRSRNLLYVSLVSAFKDKQNLCSVGIDLY